MSLNFVRVGDLSDQIRGVSYGKEDASKNPQDGYLPVLRAGNITNYGLVFSDLVYVPAAKISSKQKLKTGDIVVAASSGSLDVVGKAAPSLNDFDGGFGAFCKVMRPNEKVDAKYLAQFFKTPEYRKKISALAEGANINNLRNEHLDELLVPLPSLPEQHRIAAILDQADALRAKRREALAQLDSLVQSIFIEMFGDPVSNPKKWKQIPFGDVLSNIDSGWSPTCLDRSVMNEEWGVLKLGAMTRCEYNDAENKALQPNTKPRPELEVQAGDLLFTRKNTYDLVAACVLVQSTRPRLLMPDLIFRFRLHPDSGIDACYLHQLLINPAKRREIQKLASGSSGSMPNISKAKLQTAKIEIPPLAMQVEFSNRVAVIEELKAAHRVALAELDTLFASLQHRAFRGEL